MRHRRILLCVVHILATACVIACAAPDRVWARAVAADGSSAGMAGDSEPTDIACRRARLLGASRLLTHGVRGLGRCGLSPASGCRELRHGLVSRRRAASVLRHLRARCSGAPGDCPAMRTPWPDCWLDALACDAVEQVRRYAGTASLHRALARLRESAPSAAATLEDCLARPVTTTTLASSTTTTTTTTTSTSTTTTSTSTTTTTIAEVTTTLAATTTTTLDAGVTTTISAASSVLRVTEFHADPAALPDTQGEFLELWNAGDRGIDLLGLRLHDGASNDWVLDHSVWLAAGGYMVVARSEAAAAGAADIVFDSAWTLANSADSIIVEWGGLEQDRVVYDRSWPATPGVSRAVRAELLGALATDPGTNDVADAWCEPTHTLPDSDRADPGQASSCP